jgi:hypothetical protein
MNLQTSGVSFEHGFVHGCLTRFCLEAHQLELLIHLDIVLGLTFTSRAVLRTPPCAWYFFEGKLEQISVFHVACW